jgi:hypothetical protein
MTNKIILPEGAYWKEIDIVEGGEKKTIKVLVHDGIEPASPPNPEPAKSDPR